MLIDNKYVHKGHYVDQFLGQVGKRKSKGRPKVKKAAWRIETSIRGSFEAILGVSSLPWPWW